MAVLLTAMPLLVAGVDNILQRNTLVGIVFIVAAATNFILLTYAVHMNKAFPVAFEFLGGLVLCVVAADYYFQGKKYLPFAYVLAAVISVGLPALVRRRSNTQRSE